MSSNKNKKVRSSTKTLTRADKTSHLYRLDKEGYKHFLTNPTTSTYKKAMKEEVTRTNQGRIKYAKHANILERIEENGTSNYFIRLKDHRVSFINHATTRLINPAKSKTGSQ